ncbi:MAG: putative porin [Endomicrobium sp.]|jgi:hypothetical protein|nr:putative porin [Endomicrobium sp.]
MKFSKAVSVLAAVLFLSGASFAGEVDRLANMLAEKGLISYGEAQQIVTETREEIRQKTASGSNLTLPSWIQNMRMSGDIRVRHQADWNGSNTRNRERLRLRLGIETRPIESVKAAFGIASGAGVAGGDRNPTSTNHTFQAFDKVPVYIDYAYLQYEPVEWIKVSGGKVKNGMHLWNPTDLIWDTDINLDGFSANFNKNVGKVNIFANAGWYILNEGNGVLMPDAYIIQPGISYSIGNFSVKGGLSYQQYNMKDRTIFSNEPAAYLGTSSDTDFRCINPSIELKMKEVVAGLSLSVFGDYVKNTDDSAHKNNLEGRVFGLQFGSDRISELGTWQIKAMNRYLEEYAIPFGLGDSDAYGGSGNTKGYEVIVTLGIVKNLSLGFDYYQMEHIDGDANPRSLAQLDLSYKF